MEKKEVETKALPIVLLLLVAVILVLAWLLVRALDLTSLQKLGAFVAPFKGPWAELIMVLLQVVAALTGVIPSFPLILLSSALWGVLWGTVISLIGVQTGAVLSFLIARHAASPLLDKHLGKHLKIYSRISERYLTSFIFISRLFPVFVFELVSYGAGLTRIKFWHYFWATLLGMIPMTIFLAWSSKVFMEEAAPWFYGLTIVTVTLMISFPWLIERFNPFGMKRMLRDG